MLLFLCQVAAVRLRRCVLALPVSLAAHVLRSPCWTLCRVVSVVASAWLASHSWSMLIALFFRCVHPFGGEEVRTPHKFYLCCVQLSLAVLHFALLACK